MLVWYRDLWLIDHGASLYFHHSWTDWEAYAVRPFGMIKNHVLLPQASLLPETNEAMRSLLSADTLRAIVQMIPDEWLVWHGNTDTPDVLRDVYTQFLTTRLEHSETFTNAAADERKALV
jgi:hypothetical protein